MQASRFTKGQSSRTVPRAKTLNSLAVKQAPVFDIDQHQYQTFVTTHLRKEVSNDRSPVKSLAEAAGSSLAAAKHWIANQSTPNGIYMSRLRARFPEFNAQMRRLEGMLFDADPEFNSAFNDLMNNYLRRQGTHDFAFAMQAIEPKERT